MNQIANKSFKVAVVDEAAFLKQRDAEWNIKLVPLLSNMKRIMLLTGTNFRGNAIELYNLLKIVRPDFVPEFLKFCNRYCDPIIKKDGVQFMGPSFVQELDLLYKKRFAFRR